MINKKKAIFLILIFALVLFPAKIITAHQPDIVFLKQGDIQIVNPEISRAFYDELKGGPKYYFIDSEKDFNLYINFLVPALTNSGGKYSARIFLITDSGEQEVAFIDGSNFEWQEYYEEFGRDYYFKGPELEKQAIAGKYKIEVFSENNTGKYALAVGKTESFDIKSLLNVYWQLPLLKVVFFKTSVLQFFLTPFGIGLIGFIGVLIILIFLIYFLIGFIKETIKHNQAKTLLLTSAGMAMKGEIIKLLQRPAYDISVAFITTAYIYRKEENPDYVNKDLIIMKEMGFNIEEIDIEGRSEAQVYNLLKNKDIIFVEGGNTFYLLKAMRTCNFERVIRKLLKEGKVYIGVSAGSIVAGKTIKTAGWKDADKNIVGLKNLKGLNLVPFDIFVHYSPEHAEIIAQKLPDPKNRLKKLRILTDEQAILVQGKEVALIGKGEQIIV
ncbi:MAG: hypothetical protein A2599_01725 [Candidatus Staskawiczbacteria bacterium RIFOXYD1_FULL_39_28]|uniref:Peptidase S51 dipeptidase E n=1 Tax=Candidatus Staskawiczbacteria bacterium RIFOXYC1_FULL_38_18 TaxID=1802229 RepID=A0A1G2JEM2_9BACT|nr:MAG: hypothetical protein A2401_02305 [Candidatus Staskawiczbacteria bacterium RIFOXYC1_FULL_38_18]OGZ91346.1 MAG: hypothetical protein A2599_01725 [Candidatus Staskawiczbacteria bacterium RIFOXYD1_FULL_39_28]